MKQASVFIAATCLGLIFAGNGVSYAYEKRLDEQYVSRKEYEKLKQELEQEVEALKAQVRF